MIELEHVTKRYGETMAVDDVSFMVQPGVVTEFLGPDGAGTSTTMRMMLGLDAPSSGDVRINGAHSRDLTAPSVARKRAGGSSLGMGQLNAGSAVLTSTFESFHRHLTPRTGFAVFCVYVAAILAAAAGHIVRRDA